jgi:hypothetical protein
MKRLVFTIVAGFIGGSGYRDELAPRQAEGNEGAPLQRALVEASDSPQADAEPGADQIGAAGQWRGLA